MESLHNILQLPDRESKEQDGIKYKKEWIFDFSDPDYQNAFIVVSGIQLSQRSSIQLYNIQDCDEKLLNRFLRRSFPEATHQFTFSGSCLSPFNIDKFAQSLVKCMPSVRNKLALQNIQMNSDSFSSIIKAARNAQRIQIANFKIEFIWDLDFGKDLQYLTQHITFSSNTTEDDCDK